MTDDVYRCLVCDGVAVVRKMGLDPRYAYGKCPKDGEVAVARADVFEDVTRRPPPQKAAS